MAKRCLAIPSPCSLATSAWASAALILKVRRKTLERVRCDFLGLGSCYSSDSFFFTCHDIIHGVDNYEDEQLGVEFLPEASGSMSLMTTFLM
jgi:hypothetical protein